MTWESKLQLWEDDKIAPMTNKEKDTAYALDRLDVGRRFIKGTGIDVVGKKVLDVAVGTGGILAAFAEAGAKCYGLDVHDYFIEITKARFEDMGLRYEHLGTWKGAGTSIPYPWKFFDFVICTDTLHHAPHHHHLIMQMSEVLDTGGRIFISEERRWFPLYVLKSQHDNLPLTVLMPKFVRDLICKFRGMPSVQHHMYCMTYEIVNDFREHHIELEEIDFLKRQSFEMTGLPEFIWKLYNLMYMQFIGTKEEFPA